ncbi:cell division protein FtsQ/DivIB [Paenibacillus chartarius]|uniref:Cell division protein FtsQ/DivIB n=1 Tax=Paenibacillus chartarius TaxID=747481 RepID=A0ABV6DND3_9BACL
MPDDRVMPVLREPQRRSRSNRKLLVLLFLFFMTVLVILFFQSSLSKISAIEIQGNEFLATETIAKASGIAVGDHYFAHSRTSIANSVSKVPMVQSVDVRKRFPGLVTIEVKEYPKVGFELADDGKMLAVLADGSTSPLQKPGAVPDKPLLTGWKADDPNRLKLCAALSMIPAALLSDISEIKPDPTNGFEDKIKMYTRSQYIVETTISYLPEKIGRLPSIVDNLQENNVHGGVITMLLTDSHAPLGSGSSDASNKNDGAVQQKEQDKPTGKPATANEDDKKSG